MVSLVVECSLLQQSYAKRARDFTTWSDYPFRSLFRRGLASPSPRMGYFEAMPSEKNKTAASHSSAQVITVPRFVAAKSQSAKLTVLTAYDFTWAGIFDAAGGGGI